MRRGRIETSHSPLSDSSKSNNKNYVLRSKAVNPNSNKPQMSAFSKASQVQRPPNSAEQHSAVAVPAAAAASTSSSATHHHHHHNSTAVLPSSISSEIQRIGHAIARCDDKLANAATWERRHEALCRARALFSDPELQATIARSSDFISVVGSAMRDSICAQLQDIRSQISKEACTVVDAMASCAASALGICEAVCDWYIPTLLLVCSNSAAVVANAAAETLRKIMIRGRLNRDCLTSIYRACGEKHNAVRSEAFLCLLMAMHFAVDRHLLLKQLSSISSALRSGLSDKLPAARLRARVGCWALDALSHEAAVTLLSGCEMSIKKQVLDEEPTYGVWISRGTDVLNFTVEDAVQLRKRGGGAALMAAAAVPQQQQAQQAQQQQQVASDRPRTMSAPPRNRGVAFTAAAASKSAAAAAAVSNDGASAEQQHQYQQKHDESPAGQKPQDQQQQQQRPRSNTVSVMQDIFATPAMSMAFSPARHQKQHQQADSSRKIQQQQQHLADDDAQQQEFQHESQSQLQYSKQQADYRKLKRQQQQQQSGQHSKWQELSSDYTDSDWKHRIQVLGQIEQTVMGDDNSNKEQQSPVGKSSVGVDEESGTAAGSPSSAGGNRQVKIELPGSGTYSVEPGGSLLALAEVLYDNQNNTGVNSGAAAAAAISGKTSARSSQQQQLGVLPGFFRRDASGATPADVLHLVLAGVEDVNPRVSVAGMSALQKLLERSPVVVASAPQQLERLFKTMFLKLGDMKELVRSKAVEVLALLRKRVGADKIVPVLLNNILDLVQHRIRLACIEYLHAGVPFFDAFFQSSNNMRSSIVKIISFSQKVHTQEIGRAAIACLARLAERHRELFVVSVLALDLKEQNRVVEALHVSVPYLQQDLRRKMNREPLLLQSPPDSTLNYSLFVAPDPKKQLQQQQQQQQVNRDSASSSSATVGGNIPGSTAARAASRQRSASPSSNFKNKFPLPPGLDGNSGSMPSSPSKNDGAFFPSPRAVQQPGGNDAAAAKSLMKYDSRNYQQQLSRNGSPQKQRSQQQQRKKPSVGSYFVDPAATAENGGMLQQDHQQQQQQQQESWFVRHQNHPPASAIDQWAADRRDPPAIVALAGAVTSEDKLRALNDLATADASVWLDNFQRVAPFPIALCSDETDHHVRAAAIRCVKLVMTAPALVRLQHQCEGTMEAAVRAVGFCLEDAFPEVRTEAATVLLEAFHGAAPRYACLKAVLAYVGELIQGCSKAGSCGNGAVVGARGSAVVSGPAAGTLPFMLKHLSGLFLGGYRRRGGAPAPAGDISCTTPLLPELCRTLTRAFSHDSPDVRKLVVTAVVDLLLAFSAMAPSSVGDDDGTANSFGGATDGLDILLPHLTSLTSAQMRLCDIYWNRAAREAYAASNQMMMMDQQPLPVLELGKAMAQHGLSRKIGS